MQITKLRSVCCILLSLDLLLNQTLYELSGFSNALSVIVLTLYAIRAITHIYGKIMIMITIDRKLKDYE